MIVPCARKGCPNQVEVALAGTVAWCSVACTGGIIRQQATTPHTSNRPGLRASRRVSTPEAPTGPTTADGDTCRRGHPRAEYRYVAPSGGVYCRKCVQENRAARKSRVAS